MAHRLQLAAAVADGGSTVKNVALAQDSEATLRSMAALGARCARCVGRKGRESMSPSERGDRILGGMQSLCEKEGKY